ncbi:MAG: hypothetical protein PHU73_04655, partial [Patescibacteria group bacterium]|nr:hypothetical protein [Patescibacteria group bacterium]
MSDQKVRVTGNNPGVEFFGLPSGVVAQDTLVRFRVRVTGNSNANQGQLWIQDETGSWNNPVAIFGDIVSDGVWREYIVDLATVYRPALEVRQFSLELTNGGNGDEYWEFDWVRCYTRSDDDSVYAAVAGYSATPDPNTGVGGEYIPPQPEETGTSTTSTSGLPVRNSSLFGLYKEFYISG